MNTPEGGSLMSRTMRDRPFQSPVLNLKCSSHKCIPHAMLLGRITQFNNPLPLFSQ